MVNESEKHKLVVIGVASTLLVACVMAVGICIILSEPELINPEPKQSPATIKAVKALCSGTYYRKTCFEYVCPAAGNMEDTEELIKVVLRVTIRNITEAGKKAEILAAIEQDARSKQALGDCKGLLDSAAVEVKLSLGRIDEGDDESKLEVVCKDMRIWLSAANTYQETCLEGLTTPVAGEAAEKMKSALLPSMRMTSNSLAIADDLPGIMKSLHKHAESHHGDHHGEEEGGGEKGTGEAAKEEAAHGEGHRRRLMAEEEAAAATDDEEEMEGKEWDPEVEESVFEKKPAFVVAKDGSGDYVNLEEALENIPLDSEKPIVIRIKAGVYDEFVEVGSSMTYVVMVGDGAQNTIFTGNKNFMDGSPTFSSASFAVRGDMFMAKNIGFENTAGPAGHQAVALRVQSDMSLFYNCSIEGFQNSLYVLANRQFYRDCNISGTVDMVIGDAAAVFQNCEFRVRKPLANQECTVTAHARKEKREPTGFIIQNSTFVADEEYYPVRNEMKTYLGRPKKKFSRTIVVGSFMDDLIAPEGWLPWHEEYGLDTCFYAEVDNKGPGADMGERVKWKGIQKISKKELEESYVASKFIQADTWAKSSGVPYAPGLGGPQDSKTSNSSN